MLRIIIIEAVILKYLLRISLLENKPSILGMKAIGKAKKSIINNVIRHCLKIPIPMNDEMNSPASLASVLSTTDKSCGDIAEPKFI
ncbi:MAG: hypothetical protein MJZ90_09015 [Bacteroidales bacterium]|nr:hypothetical protein [Bacteroidales bacterium]